MGDTFDVFTFYHTILAEYPNFVKLKTTAGDNSVVITADEAGVWNLTMADDQTLTLGLGVYVKWEYVKEEHIQQALGYAFTWLNRQIPACKITEGSVRSKKIEYDKMALGSFCSEAFAPAKTMAIFLENNKQYLMNFFSEMELSNGIGFLFKLDAMRPKKVQNDC